MDGFRKTEERRPVKKMRLMQTPDGFQAQAGASTSPYKPRMNTFKDALFDESTVFSGKQDVEKGRRDVTLKSCAVPESAFASKPKSMRSLSVFPEMPMPKTPAKTGKDVRPVSVIRQQMSPTHTVAVRRANEAQPLSSMVLKSPLCILPRAARDTPRTKRPPLKSALLCAPSAPDSPLKGKELKAVSEQRMVQIPRSIVEKDRTQWSSILPNQAARFILPAEETETHEVSSSPEKADKGNRQRYKRGGLAESAKQIISRSQTSSNLWYKEMQSLLRLSKPISPDMRVKVVKMLPTMRQSPRSSPSRTKSSWALCRRLSGQGGFNHGSDVTIMFSSPASIDSSLGSAHALFEGCEIYMWRPWYEDDYKITVHDEQHLCNTEPTKTIFCTRFFTAPS